MRRENNDENPVPRLHTFIQFRVRSIQPATKIPQYTPRLVPNNIVKDRTADYLQPEQKLLFHFHCFILSAIVSLLLFQKPTVREWHLFRFGLRMNIFFF